MHAGALMHQSSSSEVSSEILNRSDTNKLFYSVDVQHPIYQNSSQS